MTLVAPDQRAQVTAAIEQIVAHEPEADQILRESVVAIYEHVPGVRSVTVAFVENGVLAPGPIAGEPITGDPDVRAHVLYDQRPVAELWVAGGGEPDEGDQALLVRVCQLLSPYCLVGWDTGGELWDP